MEAVSEHGVSVLLSSHLVADLERVCDYLVVLVGSRIQVAGEIESLLAAHHRLTGPSRNATRLPANYLSDDRSKTHRSAEHVHRVTDDSVHDPAWTVEQINLEDLVPAYMSRAIEAEKQVMWISA